MDAKDAPKYCSYLLEPNAQLFQRIQNPLLPSDKKKLHLEYNPGPTLLQKPKSRKHEKEGIEQLFVFSFLYSLVSLKLKLTSIKGFLPALSIKTAPMPVTVTYQKQRVCKIVIEKEMSWEIIRERLKYLKNSVGYSSNADRKSCKQ